MNLDPNGCIVSFCLYYELKFVSKIITTLHMFQYTDVVIHEFLHILGTDHEQTRFDRDNYIKIKWEKIPKIWAPQYWKTILKDISPVPQLCHNKPRSEYDNCYSGLIAETFGSCYDYKSIMQYHA